MATYFGAPNNRSMEVITGSQGDDAFYPLGGWDVVQGQGGFDTVFVHGLAADFRVATEEGVTYVDALSGASAGVERALLYDVERIEFSDRGFDLNLPRSFVARTGNEIFVGSTGLDSVSFDGPRSQYRIEKVGEQHFVTDLLGPGGVDRLRDVERVAFADGKVALDMSGAGRDAARLVATLLGPQAVTGSESAGAIVGQVLNLLDRGQSLAEVAHLALGLLGWDTRTLVAAVYDHALGRPGTATEIAAVEAAVQGLTSAEVAVLACELGLVDARIDLVGLADAGLAYL